MPDGTTITIEGQDTGFERHGTTTQQVAYAPLAIPNLLTLIGGFTGIVKPGFTPTNTALALAALKALFQVGPFDLEFETETNALYARSFAIARATAQSGPTSVRGGTARVGFELAELDTQQSINRFREVWQNQVAWAGVVSEAAKAYTSVAIESDRLLLSNNEQAIMAAHANSQSAVGFSAQVNAANQNLIQQFTASRHYGQVQMATSEDLTGKGFQGTSNIAGPGSAGYR